MKGIEQYFQYDASLTPIYYKGTWNASTNTPTLASSVGTAGDFYLVSVAGSTNLNGITNWAVGDWAIFNGTAWQRVEGGADGNFANLSVTGTSTLGNIQVTSNTISSVDTNGNIVLAPNGTGDVQLDADTVRVGDANANATITTNGTGDLILNTNSGTNSGYIQINDGANGNILIDPNGTGNVNLYGASVVVGRANSNVEVTSFGAGDLILETNGGTNSGTIRIYDGVNGNITLEPNGTGNVGIGTSSPTNAYSRNLQIDGSSSAGIRLTSASYTSGFDVVVSAGDAYLLNRNNTAMIFSTNASERMRLDASGNLGIGTSSAAQKLTVSSGSVLIDNSQYYYGKNAAGSAVRLLGINSGNINYIGAIDSGPTEINYGAASTITSQYWNISGSERMRIDSSGNVLIGTTSSSQNSNNGIKNISSGAVYVVNSGGTDGFSYYNTTAGAYRFYVQNNGTIAATNTTISAISDIRFKENVRDLDAGLSAIMALKPRKFDWKAGKGKDIKDDRGFIAQEFEQVFPDLIDEWKDPAPEGEDPYKSVRQDLIPVLVKAIQELNAKVEALEAQLGA